MNLTDDQKAALHEIAGDCGGASDAIDKGSNPGSRVSLTWAKDVQPRCVSWTWLRWLPAAMLSLLIGREGVGKTLLLVQLAARLTLGKLEGDLYGKPSTVLIASAEDAIEQVLQPRLVAAGADLSRVAFVGIEGDGASDLLVLPADTDAIAARVNETGAAAIFIDPLVAYVSSQVNTWRDQDVRRLLAPLHRLAERHEVSVVATIHLNKDQTKDALGRVNGSIGFTAAARSVLILGQDPEDPAGEAGSRCVLAHAKCNVGPKQASRLLRTEGRVIKAESGETIETSRIMVLGESGVGADELVRRRDPDERSAEDEAVEFLRSELDSDAVSVRTLKQTSSTAGHAWRTVERAKRRLKIQASKEGRQWSWSLPPSAAEIGGLGDAPMDADLNTVGGLGGLPPDLPQRPTTRGDPSPPRRPPNGTVGGIDGRQTANTANTANTARPPAREEVATEPDYLSGDGWPVSESTGTQPANQLANREEALVAHIKAEFHATEIHEDEWPAHEDLVTWDYIAKEAV